MGKGYTLEDGKDLMTELKSMRGKMVEMLVTEKGILSISSNVEDNVKESRIKHYRI